MTRWFPSANQRRLAAALKASNVECIFIKVLGAGHGGFRNPEIGRGIRQFFDKHLRQQEQEISPAPVPVTSLRRVQMGHHPYQVASVEVGPLAYSIDRFTREEGILQQQLQSGPSRQFRAWWLGLHAAKYSSSGWGCTELGELKGVGVQGPPSRISRRPKSSAPRYCSLLPFLARRQGT